MRKNKFEIEWIWEFNPFKFIVCPLCGHNYFISISATGVECDECNCKFIVREDMSEEGVAIYASADNCFVRAFSCKQKGCEYYKTKNNEGHSFPGAYDAQRILNSCPDNRNHEIKRIPDIWLEAPDDIRNKRWFWVLKIGGYSSGWLGQDPNGWATSGTWFLPGRTQEEWKTFQLKEKLI